MRVIALDGRNNVSLNLSSLARIVAAPAIGDCEEDSEPNDTAGSAALLSPGDVIQGGVCASNNDFYRVDHAGDWTLELTFQHADGDLDVYVWNTQDDVRLLSGGREVGSDSGNDNERFSHRGPALINVLGYLGERAPYTLRFTAN